MKVSERIYYNIEKFDYSKITEYLNLLTNSTEDDDVYDKNLFYCDDATNTVAFIHRKIDNIGIGIYWSWENNEKHWTYMEMNYEYNYYDLDDKEKMKTKVKKLQKCLNG